jgi:hypothetical protein
VKSRMHKAVKVYKTGNVKLWAKNELGAAINLSIQPGQTYYLRCGLQHGELRLQPFMELMDNTAGAYQYGKLNKANPAGSNAGLEYLRQVH